MSKQIKGSLSSLIVNMKAGLITRREFLQRAACLGLAGSIVELLESSSNTSLSCSGTNLTWWSEIENFRTYDALVQAYNTVNDCGISVSRPYETNSLHKELTEVLRKQQPYPDIMSLDVIWTDEFVSNGWIVPLKGLAAKTNEYLQLPIQSSTYQGQIYVAPFRTDIGVMYYRTDLDFALKPSDPIPQAWTWKDLEDMVHDARLHNGPDLPQYGYLWQVTDGQDSPYEALMCNFVEVLSSYGGSIMDPHDPGHVVISSPLAAEALRKMRSWLAPGSISSFDFTTSVYDEGSTVGIWKSSNAMFMRNWPTYVVDSNKDNSKVQQKFGITTLPGRTPGLIGKSCLGGWGLAINAFSPQERRDAAWNFIEWMMRDDVQTFAAIDSSFTMALLSVYNDKYLNQQNPSYSKLPDIINNYSQLRPRLPNYQPFSQAMQKQIYQILADPSSDIEGSLNTLQKTLQDIIDKGKKGHN